MTRRLSSTHPEYIPSRPPRPSGRRHGFAVGYRLRLCLVVLVGLSGLALPAVADSQDLLPEIAGERSSPGSDRPTGSTALYQCPMHPEATSDRPRKCPLCGMRMRKQRGNPVVTDTVSDDAKGHPDAEETLYVCPMHPSETRHAPGKCPVCGMFLVATESASAAKDETASGAAADGGHSPSESHSHADPMISGSHYWESSETAQTAAPPQRPQSGQPPEPRHTPPQDPEPAMHAQVHEAEPDTSIAAPSGATAYVCPMHPQIVSQEPGGSCPICGMDLVAKQSQPAVEGAPQVYLSSSVIQNMGVRTVRVERASLAKSIKTQGIVTPDDDRILYIHPRTGGWVERLYHSSEGDRVERKDELLDFYSPWINQAQLDFITALEELDMASYEPTRKGQLEAKVDSLRNTLRLLNVPPMDVMRIEKSRKVLNTIQIMAPQGGLITELNISEGSFVEPYQSMFTIVDLSEIWVMVDIFEHQAAWVRKGQQVRITTPAIPGREWLGQLEFIYPEVNPKTRTLRARIEVPNPDEALLLNMFVQVDLTAMTTQKDVVSVPREAILQTGEREIVVKALGKGHFQPVEVKTGLWGDQQVEIRSGLQAGDEIVVSGQFLIDSESSIQGSLLRLSE